MHRLYRRVMASSSVGGLSGAFIPVSEDEGMIAAARSGALTVEGSGHEGVVLHGVAEHHQLGAAETAPAGGPFGQLLDGLAHEGHTPRRQRTTSPSPGPWTGRRRSAE